MSTYEERVLHTAMARAALAEEALEAERGLVRKLRQDKIDAFKIVTTLVQRAGGEVTISGADLLDAEKLVLTSWKVPGGALDMDMRICLSVRQGVVLEEKDDG